MSSTSEIRQRPVSTPATSLPPLPTPTKSKSKSSPFARVFPILFSCNVLISLISTPLLSYLRSTSSPYYSLFHSFFTYAVGFFFITAGQGHFTVYSFFMKLIPSFIPNSIASFLVISSGIVELGLGLMVGYGKFKGDDNIMNIGLWSLIALLIAVYPVNIYTVFSEEIRNKIKVSLNASLIRLPIQFLFLGWVFACTTMTWAQTRRVLEKWFQ